ncbi:hypothetical protein VTN77DRAFT_5030 [Rasamsonia byssochlamydoides]|uniref:uncharacterized protein n=1 Tax=Rasamsonia byssochlamydoides TaxID=89139 RepID=UPI0037442A96
MAGEESQLLAYRLPTSFPSRDCCHVELTSTVVLHGGDKEETIPLTATNHQQQSHLPRLTKRKKPDLDNEIVNFSMIVSQRILCLDTKVYRTSILPSLEPSELIWQNHRKERRRHTVKKSRQPSGLHTTYDVKCLLKALPKRPELHSSYILVRTFLIPDSHLIGT